MDNDGIGLTRRAVLRGGGALGAALLLPLGRGAEGSALLAVPTDGQPLFLDDEELETLRAMVDRFIPGPPEDADPGAVDAGCAEAIDALLGAFAVDPPRIYAGAPFSDRGGHPTNHFAEFLPLDAYEELAWRLRIEGSAGRPELEHNGPVRGFQQVYREGLAALDDAAGPARFADLPPQLRDLILRSDDEAIAELVDLAFPHTLQMMYGAPEYGGNRNLAGWAYTGFDGDTQPRGYTREQVENPDDPGLAEVLPDFPPALAAMASSEQWHHFRARSGGRLSGLQAEWDKIARSRHGG